MKAVIIDHDSKGSFYDLSPANQVNLFDTQLEAEKQLARIK